MTYGITLLAEYTKPEEVEERLEVERQKKEEDEEA